MHNSPAFQSTLYEWWMFLTYTLSLAPNMRCCCVQYLLLCGVAGVWKISTDRYTYSPIRCRGVNLCEYWWKGSHTAFPIFLDVGWEKEEFYFSWFQTCIDLLLLCCVVCCFATACGLSLWLLWGSCGGREGWFQSGNSFVSNVSRVSCGGILHYGVSTLEFGLEIRRLGGAVWCLGELGERQLWGRVNFMWKLNAFWNGGCKLGMEQFVVI